MINHNKTKQGPVNIIMFWFMRDWGQYGRAYEQIARHLSERPEVGRVVCVFPPRQDIPGQYAWPLSVIHRSRKLWAVSLNPRVAPPGGHLYRLRQWANANLPGLAFLGLLRSLGFRQSNTLLWLYPPHPYIARVQKLIPHRAQVVQIVDNNIYTEAKPEKFRQETKQQYESLVSAADCVIVSSRFNLEHFSPFNPRILLFENALDKGFLAQVTELPSKVSGARPRLGYVGWLTERTDIALLEKLAAARPQYDIILAGPIDSIDLSMLLEHPNVNWLGPVPHVQVAGLIASFDVCLIPHKDTPYSRSMSPLKLFQYLGSGRPVVTTNVAGVERWHEHLLIAHDHDEFIRNVDIALESETRVRSEARIAAASGETWDIRIEQMLRQVLNTLPHP